MKIALTATVHENDIELSTIKQLAMTSTSVDPRVIPTLCNYIHSV